MLKHAVEETPRENKDKKIGAKRDTSDYHYHVNIKYGINESELLNLDKYNLD